uniref:Uncharacterized protein n=1 Tax=Arundo donax TaxID=35708 RepID=A0A0A9FL69_ARUDO
MYVSRYLELQNVAVFSKKEKKVANCFKYIYPVASLICTSDCMLSVDSSLVFVP